MYYPPTLCKEPMRYEKNGVLVSTLLPFDTNRYETGVRHPRYRPHVIIVEEYSSLEAAKAGHKKWVKLLTKGPLPKQLKEVGTNPIASMASAFGVEGVYPLDGGSDD